MRAQEHLVPSPARQHSVLPSVAAAVGLLGGFATANRGGRRGVGGALFAAAGAWAGQQWAKDDGPVAAAALGALYTAAMGGSHPLSKRIGPWPAVLVVTAVVVAASELVGRSGARR